MALLLCSLVTGADDMEEEGIAAVRLGNGATEASGDSSAGLAPTHSGQYDSTGTGTEGQRSAAFNGSQLFCSMGYSLLGSLAGLWDV